MKILHRQSHKVGMILLASCVCSFALYSFAIASTTMNISESQTMHTDIQDLRTEIAELEYTYHALMNDLSHDEALHAGFVRDESRIIFTDLSESTTFALVDDEE